MVMVNVKVSGKVLVKMAAMVNNVRCELAMVKVSGKM